MMRIARRAKASYSISCHERSPAASFSCATPFVLGASRPAGSRAAARRSRPPRGAARSARRSARSASGSTASSRRPRCARRKRSPLSRTPLPSTSATDDPPTISMRSGRRPISRRRAACGVRSLLLVGHNPMVEERAPCSGRDGDAKALDACRRAFRRRDWRSSNSTARSPGSRPASGRLPPSYAPRPS